MATPTTAEKRFFAAGFKKGSTWGTEVALGATDEILFQKMSGMNFKQDFEFSDEADEIFSKVFTQGNVKAPEPAITSKFRYEMGALGRMIAMLFGTAGTPSTVTTGVYKHTFQWADTTAGLFGTLAREYPGKVYSIPSFKPMELGLKLDKGQIVADVKGRGNTLIDDSAVNGDTQMAALTAASRDGANIALFNQAAFYMNTQSGADATGTTALVINGFDPQWKRPLDSEYIAGSQTIREPLDNGTKGEITLKLNFPRADSSVAMAFLATMKAGTVQKAVITFTGAVISTTYHYYLKLYYPGLVLTDPEVSDDDVLKYGLSMRAIEADSNPTGMSYKRPYIEIENVQATDYLG